VSIRTAQDLDGLRIVATAGGTAEPIDPVRLITNGSTGKMGTAMAQAALRRGASVTLISSAPDPTIFGLRFLQMSTVESLRAAVLRECEDADVLIMAATVSDFRPVRTEERKIKKTEDRLTIEFESVPDFLCEVRASVFKVGFAAETHDLVAYAATKFAAHGMQLVCANPVNEPDAGFGADTDRVTLLDPHAPPPLSPSYPRPRRPTGFSTHIKVRYREWRGTSQAVCGWR